MNCSRCRKDKDPELFSRSKNSRGRNYWCKDCQKDHNKTWMKENSSHRKKYAKRYRKENREERVQRKREWDAENAEHRRNYRALNRDYYRERAQFRYCRKRSATPKWLSDDHIARIRELHWLANDLRKVTGETYHVDHVVPILGEDVCGLHVPWNLQILPADINVSKNNAFNGWS